MTAPNAATRWGRVLVDELAAGGVDAVCVAPGSRSTPLTVAFAEHDAVAVFSHLDERSAAFFALGRAKRTGEPTPLVCTSGTAAAEFHPAVVEADRSRAPMILLTADRPPELLDSGANQTIDQRRLYGDAVRWHRTLPEPEADARKLRALRTTAARAIAASTSAPAGPVHLDVPFRKPLEPMPGRTEAEPDGFDEAHPRAAGGRTGPYVRVSAGRPTLSEAELDSIAARLAGADRGLIVAGPTCDPGSPEPDAVLALAAATRFPVLADPLSGLRFGPSPAGATVCGGYDGYLGTALDAWPDPDVVLRFGASPTSKALRTYLERTDPRQFLVDPAGGWREATFAATDLVTADPSRLSQALAASVDGDRTAWTDRFARAEAGYWDLVEGSEPVEGAILARAVADAPDPATLFVSNSMPVRDLDRFGRPRPAELTVLGNRGASGIDGITSTALGAGSATDDPLVLVTGDLAYYHDTNGLLALSRCGVEATIVEINNDGGGIFHMLPIEDHDTFVDQFKTPHGLDFSPTAELYGFEFRRVAPGSFREAYREALDAPGSHVIEVETDAAESHRDREALEAEVAESLIEE